jgi:hypothetical protein
MEVTAVTGRLMLLAVCGGSLVSLSLVASGQDAAAPAASQVPKVALSAQHQAMVKVGVGQEFPAVQQVADGLGTKATVVAVWKGDGAMAKSMLRDLGVDIAEQYKSPEVATFAIATGMPVAEAQQQATALKYTGPVLADEQGETFATLGTDRLPRIYVLDSKGQVVWMDIEYSLSSRRELKQALAALVK